MLYNENDPKAAAWLRELIKGGLLPAGDVHERSITDLASSDCAATSHFFAGIGGWPYALRLARWPEHRPVWTGSCPCQPFSAAGKRRGADDPRHLWAAWLRLIRECRPATILGEQVASRLGREWLAGVRGDLEALGYAVGAADLCAASVGAPHIRQRLFWVAVADGGKSSDGELQRSGGHLQQWQNETVGRLELLESDGRIERRAEPSGLGAEPRCESGGVGNADATRLQERPKPEGRAAVGNEGASVGAPSTLDGSWSTFDLLPCADGKSRRVEPGTFPLAHGTPARVGRLRGYGNAIVPQVAAAFVRAFMEVEAEKEGK